jgi:ectoine hydroxylase-related dioxygenase (phytanoyl-CoA dioxygenase family)
LRDEDTRSATSRAEANNDWRDHFNHPFSDKQAACDQARWEACNIVTKDRSFMDLIDYRRILPIVAELLSDNIFLMSSRAMIRDQAPMTDLEFSAFRLDWHRDLGTSALEMTEPHPRLSVKVAYWLTDLHAPGQGAMQVVPGSHRLTGPITINPDTGHPFGAIEIHANSGDALLFEQRLWHAAAPNITANPRICLFFAYGFRWLRPDDYREVPDELMNHLPSARKQLLGATESRYGYYLPTTADLPLRSWLKGPVDG